MQILDHGFLELEKVCAEDLDVVNAAKVSLGKHSNEMGAAEVGLINFLMRERHGTPFEHNFFKFRVRAPIMVFREWHRHRIGFSYNEQSARYKKMEPLFYIPENVRTQVGKPGYYRYEPIDAVIADCWRERWTEHSITSYVLYEEALADGVAREQARIVLPVNLYSEMIWSCNARSMMAFLSLRNALTAQWEIQQYAAAAEEVLKEHMPVTHAAFLKNNRWVPNLDAIDWKERRQQLTDRIFNMRNNLDDKPDWMTKEALHEDLRCLEELLGAI